MYLEFGPEHVRIYGGLYMPSAAEIQKVREAIANNLDTFKAIINQDDFKNSYGKVRGEQQKRIPKEFKESSLKEPLILNKQWYYFVEFAPEMVLKNDLLDLVIKQYKYSFELKEFLRKAIGK